MTLAHVARPYALARHLGDRFEVSFASHPRFASLFEAQPWASIALDSIEPSAFHHALAHGKPVYDRETLKRYVEEDCRVISEVLPDIIVGDFRVSLSVSARMCRRPYINITNAYWSPYARPDWVAPTMPLTGFLGARAATWLFRAVRPLAFAAHAKPMNDVRAFHGLPKLPNDVRYAYTDGDLTLYADLAGLIPLWNPPDSHRQLGPIDWSPHLPVPTWWASLPTGRTLVYVNLGSSGSLHLLPRILDALAGESCNAVIATAGRALDVSGRPNVFVAPYCDGAALARRAALVVCNGGSPTTQQALMNGAPVLGLPSNLDQFLNMSYVQRAQLGVACRADSASAEAIRSRLRHVLDTPSFIEAAARVAAQSNLAASHQAFEAAIEFLS